ncbi:LD-carboxypeptidase [Arcanobacterium haemolyticum]|uniref:Peptidase U61 LD-carboxypeptidase A n=1 Tax=Arcanobacterium haemolyticum (strain ATCC 9345 / DSM 20595 / CCM 5947 / CCUG 17215 / LMG 16163 / NBRC 15585 / NCTC 8452 / 11018) TaxID=644284 RepID=D7BPK0_ARCHD|nr:LD-carboxypeptidase [Arcanobacterium haemolyticum]ADH92849.1 peptidase U61 LD-carboxypeptidase A [Arcanobacterium haemolyticum DSM 20595]SQH28402.1 Murein tetrapeptide carboxypeptidase [Arcanobacterium haemolyticum]
MARLIPPCVKPGDRVAVLSPAWAAPAYFPQLHEQALGRIRSEFGLEPVEFPTTRAMGASVAERAADVNAAFADPSIRAIFTTVGGDDLIRVVPLLDPELALADPKPFFGYSDNTNILAWLWQHGIGGFHGGGTQLHLGSGPGLDPIHVETLRGALFGDDVVVESVDASEDYGLDWSDPRALSEASVREPAMPVEFFGNDSIVRGPTWGGCLEVIDQMALAGRLPDASDLAGHVLMFETSELLPPADYVGRWIRALGERGYLEAASALMFAQPVVDDRDAPAPDYVKEARRMAYLEYVLSNISQYRNDLLVVTGVPFGHTRPQAILPYGGEVTLDPENGTITAHFSR